MQCKYETRISAACPTDGLPDVYDAIFESGEMVRVEDILAAVKPFLERKAFQEEIAQELALKCRVTLIGAHSGVKTSVQAP